MKNKIGKLLRIIGIIVFILGLLGGVLAATNKAFIFFLHPGSGFVWSIALTIWFEAFIFGMIFIGLAEVIKLLELQNKDNIRIEDKNTKISDELSRLRNDMNNNFATLAEYLNPSEISNKDNNEKNNNLINIDNENFEKISKQFTSNLIKRITYTPFQDIYMIIEKNKKYLIYYTGVDATPIDEGSINKNQELKAWFQKQ